ncbi:MAG: TonB-dependent receptor [Candidatus Symbiothrix sp.]|jgi:TonB-linked SusC/RagA family outer membrane protein|nr:TonB-dependent receptor [Candidatus Symbiothrix sp.]
MKKKQVFIIRNKLLKTLLLVCVCCIYSFSLYAQQDLILTGVVTDENNETMPGVSIVVKGTPRGVTTNVDGLFKIDVKPNDVLEISFLGYETFTVAVDGRQKIDIQLKPKANELDEVTIVAFGKQKKESVVASITTVKPAELRVPSSNLTTALAGRISGIISYQRSGEPGQDNADFFVRGITTFGNGKANPLILIDGVELTTDDLSRLNTDDIASFSVMKDANATALYGARGANGVILITTKEGTEGKAKFSVRVENSFSSPTRQIELADPVTYMNLGNEAVLTRNPLGVRPYSPEKIANTGTGNPYVYPAVDWKSMMLKDVTSNQRVNMNISGGGKVARYYVAASYTHDTGVLKNDPQNKFDNNINLRRYLLRSNVNINITPTTELIVRLHGTFDDYTGPLDGGTSVYSSIMRANPVLFPAYYAPDKDHQYTKHIMFGNYAQASNTSTFYVNPYADMVKGHKDYSKTLMLAQVELKQDLGFLLKGLSARGLFNTTRYSFFDVSRYFDPFYYTVGMYDKYSDEYKLSPLNELTGSEYINHFGVGEKEITTTLYYEAALQYSNIFNEDHTLGGLLVLIGREELNGNIYNTTTKQNELQLSFPYRNIGLSGRLTYGYKSKYFVEGNFGYNGSERFSQSERFGFFPSAGAGYLVSNEDFWEPLKKTISKLKLKATYGLVGNDAIGNVNDRFFFLSKVNMDDSNRGMGFGTEKSYKRSGISISRYEDPYITWETAYKQNYGIEVGLFDKLEVQVDYFSENRKNILMERASVPTATGLQVIPSANVGKAFASGVDLSVDYSQSFTPDLWLTVHGNFTYAHSEYRVFEEPFYEGQPWRQHIGQSLSQSWGYIAERLFVDEEDVRSSPTQQFGEYGAGDIKYKDINMDGKIDSQDALPIGYPTNPEIIYGGGFSLGYRNFDLSAFFQGSAYSSLFIDTKNVSPFLDVDGKSEINSQNQLLKVIADSHWAEDNRNPYAFWPRLSDHAIDNNFQPSTWFMRDGSFVRLKTLEMGYTLPKNLTDKWHIGMLRFYLSGNNLFTFSKFKLWDPEQGGKGLNYPIQRVLNVGINVSL